MGHSNNPVMKVMDVLSGSKTQNLRITCTNLNFAISNLVLSKFSSFEGGILQAYGSVDHTDTVTQVKNLWTLCYTFFFSNHMNYDLSNK